MAIFNSYVSLPEGSFERSMKLVTHAVRPRNLDQSGHNPGLPGYVVDFKRQGIIPPNGATGQSHISHGAVLPES